MKKILINDQLVNHLAKLSALKISLAEKSRYRSQLQETIDYINNLKELDKKIKRIKSYNPRLKNHFFLDGQENRRGLNYHHLESSCHLKKSYFRVKKIF